jgi:DNA gyrase subunit A
MTGGGKLQRIRASDVSVIGRNTQGVRIMTLGADDSLAAAVRVPKDETEDDAEIASLGAATTGGDDLADSGSVPPAPEDVRDADESDEISPHDDESAGTDDSE